MSATKEIETADSPEAMLQIVKRAQNGDADAMPALRELLDRVPAIREALGGALERTVENAIIKSLSGDAAFREALSRKMTDLRKELEGPSASPIERLLVDRIVACWLQVQEADFRYSRANTCSSAQANFLLKRQNCAHRRFLTAVKTLATVRKLALPTLQVNVGEHQVNVANAGGV